MTALTRHFVDYSRGSCHQLSWTASKECAAGLFLSTQKVFFVKKKNNILMYILQLPKLYYFSHCTNIKMYQHWINILVHNALKYYFTNIYLTRIRTGLKLSQFLVKDTWLFWRTYCQIVYHKFPDLRVTVSNNIQTTACLDHNMKGNLIHSELVKNQAGLPNKKLKVNIGL